MRKNRTKLTDEIIEISVENVRNGMTYTACAQAIGVTYQTWWNWCTLGYQGKEPYARFYIKVQEAEAALQKECLDAVRTSIRLGNVEDAKWLLERKYSSEFGKSSSIKVDQKTQALNLNVNANVDKNETAQIRAAILARLTPRNIDSELKQLRNSSQEE